MQRRHFLLRTSSLLVPALGLAACGGGGDAGGDDPPPQRATPVGTLVVSNHAAITTADGQVVVIGGDRGESTLSSAVDRFDPATRRLVRITELRSGREGHAALPLTGGRILVVGGFASLEGAPSAEIVDPASGTSEPAGDFVVADIGQHGIDREILRPRGLPDAR